MTYLITGILSIKEKPQKYLDKYVSSFYQEFMGGQTFIKQEKTKLTELESLANEWAKNGEVVEKVTSIEKANTFCVRKVLTINKTKVFAPKTGWEDYLTQIYGNWKDEYIAVSGEMIVWEQTRLPLPWFYCYAWGKSKEYFVASDGKIFCPKHIDFSGKISVKGLAIDVGPIKICDLKTNREFQKWNCDHSSILGV
ncbi:hypothetical protein HY837_06285 [archaeon]|nr:hypothetical protein [archaeon]